MQTVGDAKGELIRRHRLPTRLWHWVNAVAVIVLLMSGLMISNAHPRLYWGHYGANFDAAWLDLTVWLPPRGHFPRWATIPSTYNLALARHWHLAFAWIFAIGLTVFMIVSLINRHIQRDLRIARCDVAPAHLWHEIISHARLRFPTGAAAHHYNALQKISYVSVIFVLLPLLILTGLCMMPGMAPLMGWAIDLMGGRQSARSLHFISAGLMALFIVVHLLMVILAGPYNEIRSMITGRYRVPPDPVRRGVAT
jgi:thiosulfate reductase cytochrome b subunit